MTLLGKLRNPLRRRETIAADPAIATDPAKLADWLVAWIARKAGIDAATIDRDQLFTDYGLELAARRASLDRARRAARAAALALDRVGIWQRRASSPPISPQAAAAPSTISTARRARGASSRPAWRIELVASPRWGRFGHIGLEREQLVDRVLEPALADEFAERVVLGEIG